MAPRLRGAGAEALLPAPAGRNVSEGNLGFFRRLFAYPQPVRRVRAARVRPFGRQFQHRVAVFGERARHVAQRLLALEPDFEDFARAQALDRELDAHERHRAGLGGDVEHAGLR